MTVLLRYVLRELIVPLVVWLAFLFLLLFVMQFLRATEVLLGSAVTARDLGMLLVYLGPHFLVMALPVAYLLAILIGFGRLSEDRELVAMNAVGLGPLQIVATPLVLGLVLGGVMLGLNTSLEPWGMSQVRGLINEVIKKNVVGDVKPGVFYEDLSSLTVYVEGVDEGERLWRNVLIHDDRDPQSPLLVVAHAGTVNPAGEGEALSLNLANGQVHRAVRATSDYTILGFERADINVGVEDKLTRSNRFRSPKEELTPAELRELALAEEAEGRSGASFWVALYGRFGQALSPLAFALLGTPLALSRRGGRGRGFLFTVLGYVGFYVLTRAFENLGNQEKLPAIVAAFLPALILGALGAFGLYRVTRAGAGR